MKTVNIADLKAQLSAHIRMVRDGEEVVVCDRNVPVARIVPIQSEDYSEHERRLIARGLLKPPLKAGKKPKLPKPPGYISDEVMEQVWREERDGR